MPPLPPSRDTEGSSGSEGVWGSPRDWDEKQAAKAGSWFRPMAGSHNQDSSWKNATNAAQLGLLIRNIGPEVAAGTGPEGRVSGEVVMGSQLSALALPSRLPFGDSSCHVVICTGQLLSCLPCLHTNRANSS